MCSAQTKESVLILIFTTVVVASGANLVADLFHGADTDHILKKAIIVTVSITALRC